MSAINFPLVVAQYELKGHPRRTEHWALAALHSAMDANIYQIEGGITNYSYQPSMHNTFQRSQKLRGGCLVGSVLSTKLDRLQALLQNVPVIRNDERWDCQVWIIEALRYLKSAREPGITVVESSESAIREELKQEQARWADGEDMLEDRLFAA